MSLVEETNLPTCNASKKPKNRALNTSKANIREFARTNVNNILLVSVLQAPSVPLTPSVAILTQSMYLPRSSYKTMTHIQKDSYGIYGTYSCEFCEIFKNTVFTEHLWATASVCHIILKSKWTI